MTQAMMDCPHCNNEVPLGAPRCKHCFSELTEHWEGSSSAKRPLAAVALMTLLLIGVSSWVWTNLSEQGQIGMWTIDGRENRVVLVYTSTNSEPSVRQVPFEAISRVEMEHHGTMQGATWDIYLVTRDGKDEERIPLAHSDDLPLTETAQNIASQVGQPSLVVIRDENRGDAILGAF
ncbi:MAG: hypothetical protein VX498_15130 [Myxococcota bacterium]|nr:hypothetical protein [Myxococcota bacterium]